MSLVVAFAATAPSHGTEGTIRLEGVVTDADRHSYIDVPFDVPTGTAEIVVTFAYETREERTTLDLGLWGPTGFRGWSGGSRSTFTVAADHATPGYLPGPIAPGPWRLVIGVPNIRAGVRARYSAHVELRTAVGEPAASSPDVVDQASPESHGSRTGPGWFRGDLHLHTEHSDGSCVVDGERGPCPLERTLAAARARGLDFIAVTEHNTVSHVPWLPRADRGLTVLPGQEVTTFRGHLNVIGIPQRIAFRHPDGSPRDPNQIAAEARSLGAFVVINHPALPSGEACMGCGWRPAEPTLDQVHAVEAVNGGVIRSGGGAPEGLFSGIPFWQRALSAGRPWIAIGASDNHDPDLPVSEAGALGRPLTGVWANSARAVDLLEGLRSGRVFIDVEGHPSRWLDVVLRSRGGEGSTPMGGLWAGPRRDLEVLVECGECAGLEAELHLGDEDGAHQATVPLGALTPAPGAAARIRHPLDEPPPSLRWLRIDLRRPDGSLVVLGNAIRLPAGSAPRPSRPPAAANR